MDLQTQVNLLWLMTCTALVFFMQAGFTCLEAGSVRSKNSINVALKNVISFIIAAAVYYILGYAFQFGKPWFDGLIGRPIMALKGVEQPEMFVFLYQLVFCTTAATIVSGAVAERMRFLPYILATGAMGLLIYPIYGHWVWNSEGWMHRIGYHDFAGSSVVHMIGGVVALAGIVKIGPRRGRFDAAGKPRDIHASNVPLVALGTFILIFGWMGFNGGSAPFGPQTGSIVLNTMMGGTFGGVACLLVGWALRGISGAATIMNGILAGLVAITASADIVTAPAACLIGCGGGMAYLLVDELLLRLRLDDAVSAVPVHGAAGLSGILMAGIFAKQEYLDSLTALLGHTVGRGEAIRIQAMGGAVCAMWAYIAGYLMWTFLNRISPLRVTDDEELVGLNYSEHLVRSPSDEIVSYLAARANKDDTAHPHDLEGGEYARLVSAIEGWAGRIEKERDELEQVRGWLGRDADRLYEVIRRCEEENRMQTKRLEAVAHKVDMVDRELRRRSGIPNAVSPLASEVMESVREKLREMQAGGNNVSYYWEQLRNLGSSLFRNTRSLQQPAEGGT
ncbi:MAG TPA: ammonium transporter [Fibrobacteria bacterium]|nr:ammonium transporter [Fibrobacteria bacterium]